MISSVGLASLLFAASLVSSPSDATSDEGDCGCLALRGVPLPDSCVMIGNRVMAKRGSPPGHARLRQLGAAFTQNWPRQHPVDRTTQGAKHQNIKAEDTVPPYFEKRAQRLVSGSFHFAKNARLWRGGATASVQGTWGATFVNSLMKKRRWPRTCDCFSFLGRFKCSSRAHHMTQSVFFSTRG